MRTIQSELTEKGYKKPSKDNYPIIRKKVKEQLSSRDLKELMGCSQPTYTRGKGGAFRQR
ncbi:hypothetical protein [Psychrobacillus sp. FSL K6-1464]|uniref:hypothetical protein n=1 Tax=Psychrobacillus sp. FSL K6-1464 TaxID=2921545 RepID=UPI0030F4EFA0